ncbi:PAS domain-containing sensor histidine kinase [Corallococcus sp. CA053C]|uniref:PAS domain-containing sensor histidine kinase n=1 Tax=Corallococcus sp. CA053C TaxID=2316732 RepID=UPI000EA38073|nr:PAS domain-containing hybrid sensor histidine kinase/response regulator [Corallococcus sp. CA053C]RKG92274.1 PAS domain-containing sensor histidine kinase [Corallococcus sp. CA053C]
MASPAPLPPVEAHVGARLALAEHLLACESAVACARAMVEWLARQFGVAVACLGPGDTGTASVCLASEGLTGAQQGVLARAWDAPSSVLASFRTRPGARWLAADALEGAAFPGGFLAVPLGRPGAPAVALLGVGLSGPGVPQDVAWVASCAGPLIARLAASDARAPRRPEPDRLLRRVINAVSDPVLLTDAEGGLLFANGRAEALLVAGPDASPGRARAVELNQRLFRETLAQGGATGVHRREVPLVDPVEGMDLLFELVTTPVLAPDGPAVVVSVLRNVTDLGRAAQALGESYRRLRATEREARSERHRLDRVLDSVADPIILSDPSGGMVMMNDPAERLFAPPHAGGDTADAAGRRGHANEALFASFLSNLLGNVHADVSRWKSQLTLDDPATGAPLPMEALASKVLGDQGELTGIVTVFHDRTEMLERARLLERVKEVSSELEARVLSATAELAEQNEKLRRQAIQLEQASAAKSQFLANMSHEFRTPLNAILGYTNMLLQGVSGEMTPPQRRNLTRIDSNGRHLLEVINEILDITRIEAGRMPLHLTDFGLPELLQEVMAEMDPIIARSKLAVETRLEDELPGVWSDRQKVKQIVLNLLSNALKFTHEGGVQVAAEYQVATSTFAISVKDTGIGIDVSNQEKIFEDFQQVDSSPTRAYGGTGLGLSICRRLAAMLGGRVSLQSSPGQGSTFTLHFPRRARRT